MHTISGNRFTGKVAGVFLAGLIAFSTLPAVAGEALTKPVSQWYEALETNDSELISSIVLDTATIELRDLGIIQNRTEFIDSMDQWQELNRDAEILTRQASVTGNEIVAEVCYRFSTNEAFYRESFTLTDGKINGSVQEKLGEACQGF